MLSDVRGGSYEEKLRDAGLRTFAERRSRGRDRGVQDIEWDKSGEAGRLVRRRWTGRKTNRINHEHQRGGRREEGMEAAGGKSKPGNTTEFFHYKSGEGVE